MCLGRKVSGDEAGESCQLRRLQVQCSSKGVIGLFRKRWMKLWDIAIEETHGPCSETVVVVVVVMAETLNRIRPSLVNDLALIQIH